MRLCLLVWPQVPSVYVVCPVPVEYGLPKDGEQVLLRGLICSRWVLTRTCEGCLIASWACLLPGT